MQAPVTTENSLTLNPLPSPNITLCMLTFANVIREIQFCSHYLDFVWKWYVAHDDVV